MTIASRRDLLSLIGLLGGSAAAYQAMTSLGLAAPSPYRGPVRLEGDVRGASVLVLGAGLAGLTAALELRQAGYTVQVLEADDRIGGRNRTLRGGDRIVELGGAEQVCLFDSGLHFDPGPWRIPFHHRAVLEYCRRFGVALEPFIELNPNAYLQSPGSFGGKPQRIRRIKGDFQGHVAELLAKATAQEKLDSALTGEDQEILLDALKRWGGLDRSYRYRVGSMPEAGPPVGLKDILGSRLWEAFAKLNAAEAETTLLQPTGGMDAIGRAFAERLGGIIRTGAKVVRIRQAGDGVTVAWEDRNHPGQLTESRADWCVCTIPLSVLKQIPMDVGPKLKAAITAVPYASAVKVGLQFRRRFWEEDDGIYGGVSFTNLPIEAIGYPSTGFNGGKGILLGAYPWDDPNAATFTALQPAERLRLALEHGATIHPQMPAEFDTGVAVAWSRLPFAQGCSARWTEELRAAHYDALCAIDGRLVLAGEHASSLPAWQEGAILSALDAIDRLHKRVLAG